MNKEEITTKLRAGAEAVLKLYGEQNDFEPLPTGTEYILTMLTALQFKDGDNAHTFRVERSFGEQITHLNRVKGRKTKDLKGSVRGRRCDLVVMSNDQSTPFAFIEFKIRVAGLSSIYNDLCRLNDVKKAISNGSECRYISVFQKEIKPLVKREPFRTTKKEFEKSFKSFEETIKQNLVKKCSNNDWTKVPILTRLTEYEGFNPATSEECPAKMCARFYMVSLE